MNNESNKELVAKFFENQKKPTRGIKISKTYMKDKKTEYCKNDNGVISGTVGVLFSSEYCVVTLVDLVSLTIKK